MLVHQPNGFPCPGSSLARAGPQTVAKTTQDGPSRRTLLATCFNLVPGPDPQQRQVGVQARCPCVRSITVASGLSGPDPQQQLLAVPGLLVHNSCHRAGQIRVNGPQVAARRASASLAPASGHYRRMPGSCFEHGDELTVPTHLAMCLTPTPKAIIDACLELCRAFGPSWAASELVQMCCKQVGLKWETGRARRARSGHGSMG